MSWAAVAFRAAWFATARSSLPSRSTSPAAIHELARPGRAMGEPVAWANPPRPFPRKIETVLPNCPAIARSGLPSRFRSATAIPYGTSPAVSGEPGASAKPP